MSNTQKITIAICSVIAFLGGAWLANWTIDPPLKPAQLLRQIDGSLLYHDRSIMPFSLTDVDGNLFNNARFKNKWSLVSIGYTSCPDICPDTLIHYQNIKKILSKQPKIGQNIQFVFVSIDPKRDTIDMLGKYVRYFDQSFVGATGDKGQLMLFTKGILASFEVSETDEAEYPVAHSAYLHVVSPDGKLATIIAPPSNEKKVVAVLQILDAARDSHL